MTRFQRRMMAVVIYGLSYELGPRSSGIVIRDRYAKIYSDNTTWLMNIKIEELSWNTISIVDLYSNFKFFSEVMSDYLQFKSEYDERVRLELNELSGEYLRGKDGLGYRFEGRVEGYKKVKIKDDELGRELVYQLEW